MIVYTGRIKDIDNIAPWMNPVDITVKSATTDIGKFFAPTWHMVNSMKQDASYPWGQYVLEYESLMRKRVSNQGWKVFDEILKMEVITLICFCRNCGKCA